MSRLSRVIPIVGGAIAGGAIALVVARAAAVAPHVVTHDRHAARELGSPSRPR